MVSNSTIEVQGSKEFKEHTDAALDLLRCSSHFAQIKPYVSVIREAKCSGMRANTANPAFEVGQQTWQSPTIWYASAIIHDGYHSKLYHEHRRRFLWLDFTPSHSWTGTRVEQECLIFQIRFLRSVDADKAVLDYVEALIADPIYHRDLLRDW
jgi:hypothetical protein